MKQGQNITHCCGVVTISKVKCIANELHNVYSIQYKKVYAVYALIIVFKLHVLYVCTVTNTITTTLLSQAWVAGLAVPSNAAALPL